MNDRMLDGIMKVMGRAFDPAFGEAWTRRQVADAMAMPRTYGYVVGRDAKPVSDPDKATGFTLSRSVLDEEELLLIAVDPAARRCGIGKSLLGGLIDDAASRGISRLFLEMRDGNPAEALYRSFGFEPIGRRPQYYLGQDGRRIDAVTFGLRMNTSLASRA